jgi:molecular chaperone DnaJ
VINSPCPQCRGGGVVQRSRRIKVRIPSGVDNESRLRLQGEGEAGVRGGPAGDLYVVIYVKPHNVFERRDDDLLARIPIGFVQATLGAEVEVPTLDGKTFLKIPPGTQPDTVFRLRGKGMPHLNGFGRGDELVRVMIQVPTQLTSRQRELLTELGKETGEVHTNRRFFG